MHWSVTRAAGKKPMSTAAGGNDWSTDVRYGACDHRTRVHVCESCCWWHGSPFLGLLIEWSTVLLQRILDELKAQQCFRLFAFDKI